MKSDLATTEPGVRFADAGRRLVAETRATNEGRVLFWDLTRPEQPPKAFTQSVRSLPFGTLDISPDGRWVSVIGKAGAVLLYDAAAMERRHVVQGAMQEVHGTAFSPDGRRFVSGAVGREAIQLWQVDTGQELLTLPGKGLGLFNIGFVEDGNTLFGGSQSRGSWQMWRAPSWEVIAATEAKDPPSPGSGGQGKAEGKQP